MSGFAVIRLAMALLMLLGIACAHAARISIDASNDPNSRLEIRTVTLPDGAELVIYVLSGAGLIVTIDGDELVADHVEVDLTNRTVRVIGEGRFTTGSETVEGRDLVIDLRQESFAGDDVLIITPTIDVKGDRASRVPGLIRVAMGEFSPCTRCGQELDDYGFEADTLEIYPGDRLVAYDVTVLIRGAEVMALPLMVLPIGPQERQPRFEYATGTATERARITINWPYVAGPDAYGDVGFRYYADVDPGGSAVGDLLLGGSVERSYFGASLNHRFYTERGKGGLLVDFTPGFQEPTSRSDPQFKVRFSYADEAVLGPPTTAVLLERDDARRARLWEASISTINVTHGVRGAFSSQVFLDVDPSGVIATPSYASRSVPLMTLARLELEPEETNLLTLGTLRVERLLLDLGVFQDRSNSLNRSAAATPIITSGRVREAHTLNLTPLSLWTGASLSGRTDFTGYYYGTNERQVEWLSRLQLRQQFGRSGDLTLSYRRDIREGETPFRFDLFPYRNRSELRSELRLDPTAYIRFEQSGGYVLVDDRNPDDVGWAPLTTTLMLLNNVDWVTLTLRNEYDLKEPDPGTLDATLVLRSRGTLSAELEVKHQQDLLVTPDRLSGEPRDVTQTSANASLRVGSVVELSARSAYRYAPPAPTPGEQADRFDDLELKLTLGSLRHDDALPGLSVTYARDLNEGRVSALEVAAAATAYGVQFDASERISFPTGRVASSRLRLAYPGVLAAQADGLAWLPTATLGLPQPDPYSRNLAFALEEAPERGNPSWQVRFTTVVDPALATVPGQGYGYRGSTLTGRVLLTDKTVPAGRFSVDGFAELLWRDDRQPSTYLRRANLAFGVDLWGWLGLQGTVGYSGTYDIAAAEVSSGKLTLQEVAVMVRPTDSLYLGALLTDVWDLTGNDPNQPAFNFQPTFVAVWNRCCWALYGSWNSASGALSITLTTPGADQGLNQVFKTGWVIPKREP